MIGWTIDGRSPIRVLFQARTSQEIRVKALGLSHPFVLRSNENITNHLVVHLLYSLTSLCRMYRVTLRPFGGLSQLN